MKSPIKDISVATFTKFSADNIETEKRLAAAHRPIPSSLLFEYITDACASHPVLCTAVRDYFVINTSQDMQSPSELRDNS